MFFINKQAVRKVLLHSKCKINKIFNAPNLSEIQINFPLLTAHFEGICFWWRTLQNC